MENASKALLMSASILIAILILVIAVRVFKSASDVSKSYDKTMSSSQVSTFNTNFTKFMGAVIDNSNNELQKYATIYDVISTANFAYDYNCKLVRDPSTTESLNDPGLVKVDLKSKDGAITITNLQIHPEKYNTLLQECHYQNNMYPDSGSIVTYEITINSENAAGRINHVTFTPMQETADTVNGMIKVKD